MEASFFDYIICDEVVLPPNQEYSLIQKPIYLPHTHVCTDNTRKISERKITKSEMGLPDNSFVFCCFNSNYKITAKEFNIWANILRQIENSVLWLMPSSIVSRGNLLNEAKKRGIDNSRIIFTKYLPADEHIARYKLADLFIDTFNYNAATTATEALWAGLPVVTKRGNSFTARLCSSILNALDLNELITSTEQEYEDLIINLAKQNDKLGQLKSKVAQNIASKPLFDTTAFTRCFENGLQQAHELAVLGSEPRTIYAKDK
jgi:predicted O-linked N-acetylglucosamine transferase (SPINDLY family)